MSRLLAVAADRDFPDLDDGWPLLRAALEVVGVDTRVVAWNAGDKVDWSRFDAVLVSYCWGYVRDAGTFLEWAEDVESVTLLVNPATAVGWNCDKTYLADLAALGVPTVPTAFVTASDPTWTRPSSDWVIKPTVGSGGLGAARFTGTDVGAADRHLRAIHERGQVAMVQPYQAAVDAAGETALVYVGGTLSHTVTKSALLEPDVGEIDGLWEREIVAPGTPRPDQLAVAGQAIDAVTDLVGPVAYGRVDLVDDLSGRPVVLEVEIVEPTLFLPLAPGAAVRLAAELAARVG